MIRLDFLKRPPALILSAILLLQGAVFYGTSRGETTPAYTALNRFPPQFGAWRMIRQGVIEPEVKEVLRADDYITREYAISPAQTALLFVAFFKSQRAGQTPHSPKNCLPGSGWIWSLSDTIPISIPGRGEPMVINRYLVSKGDRHSLVLYWYQSRDRVVASEYKAAAYVAWDAIRYNRTDTALVRVVVPVDRRGEDAATQTGVEFIRAFFPILRKFLPA